MYWFWMRLGKFIPGDLESMDVAEMGDIKHRYAPQKMTALDRYNIVDIRFVFVWFFLC